MPADTKVQTPRYNEYQWLLEHGQWSHSVPEWAKDHTGRMVDGIAKQAVIEELAEQLTARTAENEQLRNIGIAMEGEIAQVLGRALGYPRYCDDQKNFPGATDADGVCVGDHVGMSLVAEAAKELVKRAAELEEAKRKIADLEYRLNEVVTRSTERHQGRANPFVDRD